MKKNTEARRDRSNLIQAYKILDGIDDITAGTFFQMTGADYNHTTRSAVINTEEGESNRLNLEAQRANLDVRRYYFSHRVVIPWNNLPNSDKFASSVNNFWPILKLCTGLLYIKKSGKVSIFAGYMWLKLSSSSYEMRSYRPPWDQKLGWYSLTPWKVFSPVVLSQNLVDLLVGHLKHPSVNL